MNKKEIKEPVKMTDTISQFKDNYTIGYDRSEKEKGVEIEKTTTPKNINKKVNVGKRIVLNLRNKPSLESRVLTTLANNTKLEVFANFEHEYFYKVKTPDGKIGYCYKKHVK